MKTWISLLITLAVLSAVPTIRANGSAGSLRELAVSKDDSLSALSQKLACDRIYRVQFPLFEWRRQAVVIFGFPSYSSAKAAGAKDAYAYAIQQSKLLVLLLRDNEIIQPQSIAVDEVIFSKLLSAFASSEVFNLPSEWTSDGVDYVEVGALDSGPVIVECLGKTSKLVKRVYGQSAPVTGLADKIREILNSKIALNNVPAVNP